MAAFCCFQDWAPTRCEAGTALHGIAVSQTGDTGALVGNNLVAFRNGVALKNLKDRTVSPLQYYVCALFMRFGTTTSLLARMPFSLIGFAALTLMAFRINRVGLEWKAKMIYFLCILLSVPLFLYFLQCRYYSLVLFFPYFYTDKKKDLGGIWFSLTLRFLG